MDFRKRGVKTLQASLDTIVVPPIQPRYRWLLSIGVLGLALGLLFYQLGNGSLHDWDEAIYAQVAREMLHSASWSTLSWNGTPFFHKPPLYFWLTAFTYKIIGVSELAARLWPAIFGFGVIVLTFVLGTRVQSWVVGTIAALLLLVVDRGYYGHWWNFLSLSRVGMLETALTFWIMAALVIMWEAERRPWLVMLIGLPIGMAVMTKAWSGLLAVAIPFAFWLIAARHRSIDWVAWGVGTLLALVVITPWHLWQYTVHGPLFVHEYVGINLTSRLFRALEGHTGGPLDYVDILRHGFSLWGYLWPLAYLWAMWKAIVQGDRRMKLLLVWITLPLLLFSVAQTKLGWYISMVYPAIALLLALALVGLLTQRVALGLAAAVMFVCCLRLPVAADGSREVKHFARQAVQSVNPAEPIYVAQDDCAAQPSPHALEKPLIPVGHIRPSLRFYLNRPLICIEPSEIQTGRHPRHRYVVSEQVLWSHISHSGHVVLESDGFILARWE